MQKQAEKASKTREGLTRLALAAALGCAVRTIHKWEGEGLPVAIRGRGKQPSRYDETAVRAWLQTREGQIRQDTAGLTAARTQREHWQAKLAHQQYQVRGRMLLPVEQVDRIWSGQVAAVRARLLLMPQTLADKLLRIGATDGAAGIERELERAIHQVLTELSTGKTTKPRKPRTPSRARRTTPQHKEN